MGNTVATPQKITSSVMLWTLKGSFEERVETAALAGMQSVELVGEHAQWSPTDASAKLKFVRSFNLGMDTIIATPNWAARPVSMLDPAQRDNFLADVRKAIDFARRLEVPQIILMSGNTIAGRPRAEQYASLVDSAKRAAELAANAQLTLIIEPLNSKVNHKGYFLDTCVEGLKVVKEVNAPSLKLLFDLYHEQVQTGDVTRTLIEAAPHTAVFHVAGNPGRNDPTVGEMNYPHLYRSIKQTRYTGYICMEYLPLGSAAASLKTAVDNMRASLV